MRVAFFPNGWRENPYLDLLEGSLSELGITVHPTPVERPYRSWLKDHQGEIDVLHLHWLNYIYREPTLREAWGRVLRLADQLLHARRLGYRVVWTMHNLYPHERNRWPQLDRWVRLLVAHLAHAVVVHCEAAKSALGEAFGRRRNVFVAPHGNYIGVYLDTVTRSEARKRLGIGKECYTFLFLGQLRPYKGLGQLIHAFVGVRGPHLRLLVAGKARDARFYDRLVEAARIDSRITIHSGWVPRNEVQVYLRASDAVVCPFETVLTSGAVMLAMSFGRPVIAPAMGCLPELVPAAGGILYDAGDKKALGRALAECHGMDLDQMGQSALSFVRHMSWSRTARAVAQAYAGLSPNGSGWRERGEGG